MDQAALGAVHQAAHARVVRVVDLEILVRQVPPALAAGEQAGVVDAVLAAGPFADRERVARGAAGLVDQGRGCRPAGVVESGLVQQPEAALESVIQVHSASFPRVSARALPKGMRFRSQVGAPPPGASWILQ